jgi:hypothetical protein
MKINETELRHAYEVERKTLSEIANSFACSEATIKRGLKKFNIPKRGHRIIIPKEELERLYYQEGHTLAEIGRRKGCSAYTVSELMKGYGLDRRNSTRKISSTLSKILSKEFLVEEYIKKRRNSREIAEMIGCSSGVVIRFLRKYNLHVRNKSEAQFGRNITWSRLKELRSSTEFQKRMFRGLCKKPNKKEQKLLSILEELLPKEYCYTGDGKVLIYGLSPDFVNCNGKKKIIELFGDYWHLKKKKINWYQTEWGRKAIFSQLGYDTLIVWENELKNIDLLKEKILKFHEE